jgi:hypothetical protein
MLLCGNGPSFGQARIKEKKVDFGHALVQDGRTYAKEKVVGAWEGYAEKRRS